MNKLLISNTISFLRFPLIVAILFVHSYLLDAFIHPMPEVTRYVVQLFSREIGQIAVPLFFIISGFLFFFNVEEFGIRGQGRTVYFRKLKSRLFSLVIPYLFWCLLAFIRRSLTQYYFGSMMSDNTTFFKDFQWFHFIKLFTIAPAAQQLWFIRDLIIMAIFSPLFYYIIKFSRIISLTLILILIALWCLYSPLPLGRGIIFFLFGAWLSINKIDFATLIKDKALVLTVIYAFMLVQRLLCFNLNVFQTHRFTVIVGIMSVVALVAYGLDKGSLHINPFLTSAAFYIFCFHNYYIVLLQHLLINIIPIKNNFTMTLLYFSLPTIITSLGLLFYYLLRKYFPKFTNIICGSR